MANPTLLAELLQKHFKDALHSCTVKHDEVTIEVPSDDIKTIAQQLRDEPELHFEMLIDLAGVDYLKYGKTDWETNQTTHTGFERGVDPSTANVYTWTKPRFAVVYHLLSVKHNHRLRVRAFVDENIPKLSSVITIWSSANWFEREAFDLFGILFEGHPDLRRLLTDYGFIGHPFRKDFPISGHVEVRYDPEQKRVIYQPVTIEPRTLVPRVIRDDNRMTDTHSDSEKG